MSQNKLLEFDTFGNVSLIHVTDIHAQLKPIYFREPEININGDNRGQVPHVTGAEYRKAYGIDKNGWSSYALSYEDASRQEYGRVGGQSCCNCGCAGVDRPDALCWMAYGMGATPANTPSDMVTR